MSFAGSSILYTPAAASASTVATESVSSKHHQVVCLAGYYGHLWGSGDVYVAHCNIALATSQIHMSIYNADSTLIVDLLQIAVAHSCTAATSRVRAFTLVRFSTAHTGGTLVTPLPLDTAMTSLSANITVRRSAPTCGGADSTAIAAYCVDGNRDGSDGARNSLMYALTDFNNATLKLKQNEGIYLKEDGSGGTGGNIVLDYVFRVR